MSTDNFRSLFSADMAGWKMAGQGGFRIVGEETIESYGGPGLYWYERESYENFVLKVEYRTMRGDANSGVFIRCPALADDPQPAIARGYEIQIDEYGVDPEDDKLYSPLHVTGAIYKLARARIVPSRGAALGNDFVITVRGDTIEVVLNGESVSKLESASREPRGHIALQAHHEGSNVQFRALRIAVM